MVKVLEELRAHLSWPRGVRRPRGEKTPHMALKLPGPGSDASWMWERTDKGPRLRSSKTRVCKDMGGYELGWLVGKLVKVVKLGQVAEACVRSAALCVLRAGADAKLLRTKARSSVEDLKGLRPVDFRRRLDLLGIPVSL